MPKTPILGALPALKQVLEASHRLGLHNLYRVEGSWFWVLPLNRVYTVEGSGCWAYRVVSLGLGFIGRASGKGVW